MCLHGLEAKSLNLDPNETAKYQTYHFLEVSSVGQQMCAAVSIFFAAAATTTARRPCCFKIHCLWRSVPGSLGWFFKFGFLRKEEFKAKGRWGESVCSHPKKFSFFVRRCGVTFKCRAPLPREDFPECSAPSGTASQGLSFLAGWAVASACVYLNGLVHIRLISLSSLFLWGKIFEPKSLLVRMPVHSVPSG